MPKLAKPIELQTAFNDYVLDVQLGEGGAGRVYGGRSVGGDNVAIKVLTAASRDKRQRFKNEISFLSKAKHPNLVVVTDSGLADSGASKVPFYVMPRYDGSLRMLMREGVEPGRILEIFSQILDGVEAAHLLGVTHRDLKPENVLVRESGAKLAIADFGVASFTADLLITQVETGPTQRLANFMYSAPEQRAPGTKITAAADIYALGLMINEMFTGTPPHGTSYRQIADVSPEYGFLDAVVASMIAQAPNQRPESIQAIKTQIQRHRFEAVAHQRLSVLNNTVVKVGDIDDSLASEPPILADAEWRDNRLTLVLDRDVPHRWTEVLKYRLGNYNAVMGRGPETFNFGGAGLRTVTASASENEAQRILDAFKTWLPIATRQYHFELEQERDRKERERRQMLERERLAEEQLIRVNRSLKI